MENQYRDIDTLYASPPDALIITGAEPRADDLRDEACWPALIRLIDWAIDRRMPVVFSCLAAHAAVLHLSGIPRRRLARKASGVFSFAVRTEHRLLRGAGAHVLVPHSRWNELAEASLAAEGYRVLAASAHAGVDGFVHDDAPYCLFVQGHPEYEIFTLPAEYRRDVKRYLAGATRHYPIIPTGCFDNPTVAAFRNFERVVRAKPAPESFGGFPVSMPRPVQKTVWQNHAAMLYRNWLDTVADATCPLGVTPPGGRVSD